MAATTRVVFGEADVFLRDVWPSLSLDRRRSILAVVIEQITVHPQKPLGPGGFDPDSIEVTWKA